MAVDEQDYGVQGLLLSDTACVNYRVAGVDPELSMGGKGEGLFILHYWLVTPTS